jgi:hypothetical protein
MNSLRSVRVASNQVFAVLVSIWFWCVLVGPVVGVSPRRGTRSETTATAPMTEPVVDSIRAGGM